MTTASASTSLVSSPRCAPTARSTPNSNRRVSMLATIRFATPKHATSIEATATD
jgi:hypothetical protein